MQWSFLTFFFIFEVGSAICGAAQSSTMLIVGRAIAGIGASGLLNGGYTILALVVAPARQAGKIDLSFFAAGLQRHSFADIWAALRGVLIGLAFLGLLAGPLVGGAFTSSSASWRWCEYLILPLWPSLEDNVDHQRWYVGLTETPQASTSTFPVALSLPCCSFSFLFPITGWQAMNRKPLSNACRGSTSVAFFYLHRRWSC